MSLFEKIFPKQAVDEITAGYMKTLTGYEPVFRNYSGGIYESELCRASIHAIATHCSKLKPTVQGARKDLQKILEYKPNPWMDATKFLYKLATILESENTAFVVPMYDQYYEKIIGFYPVRPSKAEVREKYGTEYLVFEFAEGQRSSLEFDRVGILSKFFYKHDFFGEDNKVLNTTLDLIYTQQQGIQEGIKQSATIRFLGKLASALKPDDVDAERQRWIKQNLTIGNNGGIALFDAKYSSVTPIDSKPYNISSEQLKAVQSNVFNYFGVSEEILRNDFTSDKWAAFYEGKIEPFALQLSLVISNMLYTAEQKTRGNSVMFTSNRLQYATTNEKLAVVQQMSDRGMMSRNEGREVFNLPPIDGGDDYIIRGEYYNADDKMNEGGSSNE